VRTPKVGRTQKTAKTGKSKEKPLQSSDCRGIHKIRIIMMIGPWPQLDQGNRSNQ